MLSWLRKDCYQLMYRYSKEHKMSEEQADYITETTDALDTNG